MSDLIYRQEAIIELIFRQDAVKTMYDLCEYIDDESLHIDVIVDALENLPSASTDISTFSDKLWKIAYERGKAEGRKKGKWILDEDPHDGDCRCSACLIAIGQMHERNHSLLNALTGGKWWTFYKFCPNCGADMIGGEDDDEERS